MVSTFSFVFKFLHNFRFFFSVGFCSNCSTKLAVKFKWLAKCWWLYFDSKNPDQFHRSLIVNRCLYIFSLVICSIFSVFIYVYYSKNCANRFFIVTFVCFLSNIFLCFFIIWMIYCSFMFSCLWIDREYSSAKYTIIFELDWKLVIWTSVQNALCLILWECGREREKNSICLLCLRFICFLIFMFWSALRFDLVSH